jgi:hypothetical protein
VITSRDIAWAAGIYEGEGNFTGVMVRVVQKDSWLPYELQKKFGGKVKQYTRSTDGKEYHFWSIGGATARGFLLTIFSYLSSRRKEQILKHPLFFKDPDFLPAEFCPNGHPYNEENIYWETGYDEKGQPRKWRTCKICRKAHYDRKNQKRREESPEEVMIRIIAKAKNLNREDAKALLESNMKKM